MQNTKKSLNPSSWSQNLTYLYWSTTILTSADILWSFFWTLGPFKAKLQCRHSSCNSNGRNRTRPRRRRLFLTCWTNGSIVLPLGAWNHLICQGQCYIIPSKGPRSSVCVCVYSFLLFMLIVSVCILLFLCISLNIFGANKTERLCLSVCGVAWGNIVLHILLVCQINSCCINLWAKGSLLWSAG